MRTRDASITKRIQEMEERISSVEDSIEEIDSSIKENDKYKNFLNFYLGNIQEI